MRGTGFRHTLPAVFPFAAVWIVVVVLTAPTVTIAMMLSGVVRPSAQREVLLFLLIQVPILAVAAVALAIFTTQRAAGALVGPVYFTRDTRLRIF